MKNKKCYLKKYILQEKKIERLNEMIILHPEHELYYALQIKHCKSIQADIELKISSLNDEILSEILFLKYICGKNLKEISIIIDYSYRHTQRMHTEAVEKIEI